MPSGAARIRPIRGKNRQRQAEHFDQHSPLTPWPQLLMARGFQYQYIAKDVLIKNALDEIGLEPGSRVLDVGCGTGIWLNRLGSSFGARGIGVDVSMRSLRNAGTSRKNGHQFVMADAMALPFRSGSFDLTASLDTLEHIVDVETALSEMIRAAIPGKHILLYAVSKKNAYTLQWLERKLLAFLGINLHSLACHDPDLFVAPEEVIQLLHARTTGPATVRHFHAFFSTLFDRSLLLGYLACRTLGLFGPRGVLRIRLGGAVLGATTVLCRLVFKSLLFLDRPWFQRGLSNGFLAVAVKGNKNV